VNPPKASAASLRIAVVGRSPLATLWALVLRDYGRHRVIGYGLDPRGLRDADAIQRWEHEPVANAPAMRILLEHADLVYVLNVDRWWSILNLSAAYHEPPRPPLVVARWMPSIQFRGLAQATNRATAVVYSPLRPTDDMDELTDPTVVWACSEDSEARALIERVWRPINNKVPVAQTGLPQVSETGLAWSPVAYAESVGLLTPQAVEILTERPREPGQAGAPDLAEIGGMGRLDEPGSESNRSGRL